MALAHRPSTGRGIHVLRDEIHALLCIDLISTAGY